VAPEPQLCVCKGIVEDRVSKLKASNSNKPGHGSTQKVIPSSAKLGLVRL
jgi:hypothetical protein